MRLNSSCVCLCVCVCVYVHLWIFHLLKISKSQIYKNPDDYFMEKEMATHSSVLAWKIPRMMEPGGLPSMGRTELDMTEAT